MDSGNQKKRITWLDLLFANSHKIYVAGIILLVSWTALQMGMLGYENYFSKNKAAHTTLDTTFVNQQIGSKEVVIEEAKKTEKNSTSDRSANTENKKAATLTELIIEPIVTSKFHKIIFNSLFLYLTWILVFLIAPIAFFRLKRFKFFNLEIEIEKKDAATVEAVNTSSSKMFFATFLTTEEFQNELLGVFDQNIRYKGSIEYTLNRMNEFYMGQFGKDFTKSVYSLREFNSNKFPIILKKSVDKSRDNKEAIYINKSETDSIYYKNYLLMYNEYKGTKFITLLESYNTEFDTFDKHLVKVLHNLVNDYFIQYEYVDDVAHIQAQ